MGGDESTQRNTHNQEWEQIDHAVASNNPHYQVACKHEIKHDQFNSNFVMPRHTPIRNGGLSLSLEDTVPRSTKTPFEWNSIKFIDRKSENTLVEFSTVDRKGPNYLKYCTGFLTEHEKPSSVRDCVLQYTSGKNWYCTKINIALASDAASLKEYGPYIKQLKYCIGTSAPYIGTVYRGMDMSSAEIETYEKQDMFFIPSFTSTSKTKAFDKNTLIHVDITPEWSRFCMEIHSSQTDYQQENEVLLSCYNLYSYERTEKSNGKRMIKLRLMDYDKYFDYRANTIRD